MLQALRSMFSRRPRSTAAPARRRRLIAAVWGLGRIRNARKRFRFPKWDRQHRHGWTGQQSPARLAFFAKSNG
jgi:hypothetical protein